MTEEEKDGIKEGDIRQDEASEAHGAEIETEAAKNMEEEISALKDRYLRLYADFENYKKRMGKEREELIKYCNEDLVKELLSVLDHLELALQHSQYDNSNLAALKEGVEITLKEMKTILEKFGLLPIETLGKPFDPFVHHAMAQVESNKDEENTVVTEFRKGYLLRDRVIRAALVGVSKKPVKETREE